MAVLAAVCGCSFLAWPSQIPPLILALKYLSIALWIGFFGYQFLRLHQWQLRFWLDEAGQLTWHGNGQSLPVKNLVVGSYLSAFYVGANLIIVWRDMCDDGQYRTMCRILLKSRQSSVG
ncbi:hypothetical protein FLM48_05425 [Shewanella sp. Scap07]|uniref:hypothetical protein n=1 Tax=Shewanella sp. Scap07 TaxID=2589987 RepID=UPI0015BEF56D|nr:hypothetical protein [Shewanella sp. Scap07]QLE84578.1 hypothetical protein FLM48_05425 [Shewanella sp. Scap07]